MKTSFFQQTVTAYPATKRHITGHRNFILHSSEDLETGKGKVNSTKGCGIVKA